MEKNLIIYLLNAVEYIEELEGLNPDIILNDVLGCKDYTYVELLEEFYKEVKNNIITKEE